MCFNRRLQLRPLRALLRRCLVARASASRPRRGATASRTVWTGPTKCGAREAREKRNSLAGRGDFYRTPLYMTLNFHTHASYTVHTRAHMNITHGRWGETHVSAHLTTQIAIEQLGFPFFVLLELSSFVFSHLRRVRLQPARVRLRPVHRQGAQLRRQSGLPRGRLG